MRPASAQKELAEGHTYPWLAALSHQRPAADPFHAEAGRISHLYVSSNLG